MNRLIRRGHPDDYDDDGNHQPGPYPAYRRFARCQPGCCNGTPICYYPEEDPYDPEVP